MRRRPRGVRWRCLLSVRYANRAELSRARPPSVPPLLQTIATISNGDPDAKEVVHEGQPAPPSLERYAITLPLYTRARHPRTRVPRTALRPAILSRHPHLMIPFADDQDVVRIDRSSALVDFSNAYRGACLACDTARTCAVCLQTAACEQCTAGARCGSCRNLHSRANRAAGLCSSRGAGGTASSAATLRRDLPPPSAAGALDLPRARAGLNELYHLIASTTSGLWCATRGALPDRTCRPLMRLARAAQPLNPPAHPRAGIGAADAGLSTRARLTLPSSSSTPRTSTRRRRRFGATPSQRSGSLTTRTPRL